MASSWLPLFSRAFDYVRRYLCTVGAEVKIDTVEYASAERAPDSSSTDLDQLATCENFNEPPQAALVVDVVLARRHPYKAFGRHTVVVPSFQPQLPLSEYRLVWHSDYNRFYAVPRFPSSVSAGHTSFPIHMVHHTLTPRYIGLFSTAETVSDSIASFNSFEHSTMGVSKAHDDNCSSDNTSTTDIALPTILEAEETSNASTNMPHDVVAISDTLDTKDLSPANSGNLEGTPRQELGLWLGTTREVTGALEFNNALRKDKVLAVAAYDKEIIFGPIPKCSDFVASQNQEIPSEVRFAGPEPQDTLTSQHTEQRPMHHFNFNGQPICEKNSTSAAVSLWATVSRGIVQHWDHGHTQAGAPLLRAVVTGQAAKLVNPYIYTGAETDLALTGSALQEAVTGGVRDANIPEGTWCNDYYGLDEEKPLSADRDDYYEATNPLPARIWTEDDKCVPTAGQILPDPYMITRDDLDIVVNDDGRVHNTMGAADHGFSRLRYSLQADEIALAVSSQSGATLGITEIPQSNACSKAVMIPCISERSPVALESVCAQRTNVSEHNNRCEGSETSSPRSTEQRPYNYYISPSGIDWADEEEDGQESGTCSMAGNAEPPSLALDLSDRPGQTKPWPSALTAMRPEGYQQKAMPLFKATSKATAKNITVEDLLRAVSIDQPACDVIATTLCIESKSAASNSVCSSESSCLSPLQDSTCTTENSDSSSRTSDLSEACDSDDLESLFAYSDSDECDPEDEPTITLDCPTSPQHELVETCDLDTTQQPSIQEHVGMELQLWQPPQWPRRVHNKRASVLDWLHKDQLIVDKIILPDMEINRVSIPRALVPACVDTEARSPRPTKTTPFICYPGCTASDRKRVNKRQQQFSSTAVAKYEGTAMGVKADLPTAPRIGDARLGEQELVDPASSMAEQDTALENKASLDLPNLAELSPIGRGFIYGGVAIYIVLLGIAAMIRLALLVVGSLKRHFSGL